MKYQVIRSLFLFSLLIVAKSVSGNVRGEITIQDTGAYVSPFAADNERCFRCHGQERYEYTNETLGRQVKALMCTERIMKREEFYDSNHKSFSCTDCHSGDYVTFPHPGELRIASIVMAAMKSFPHSVLKRLRRSTSKAFISRWKKVVLLAGSVTIPTHIK
jgi:hypothetical protein